ncbi:uncharacterized protein BDR25DRAFT_394829 [Lindgomyces ingoldianus]|uniref:Uncharacterized protein n=1 Tax=Lindgomyces ingoldianus TaxID=673940 RepID=A0ACB6QP07_9PLEO|nr:uncharacterized protein BDR25DRAFT_394829 [Lindgomyces ingoldianus]KAF2468646.1 hypothetical protein BDR25DRAFT_394829 [Lindgomyces ingoldianus]
MSPNFEYCVTFSHVVCLSHLDARSKMVVSQHKGFILPGPHVPIPLHKSLARKSLLRYTTHKRALGSWGSKASHFQALITPNLSYKTPWRASSIPPDPPTSPQAASPAPLVGALCVPQTPENRRPLPPPAAFPLQPSTRAQRNRNSDATSNSTPLPTPPNQPLSQEDSHGVLHLFTAKINLLSTLPADFTPRTPFGHQPPLNPIEPDLNFPRQECRLSPVNENWEWECTRPENSRRVTAPKTDVGPGNTVEEAMARKGERGRDGGGRDEGARGLPPFTSITNNSIKCTPTSILNQLPKTLQYQKKNFLKLIEEAMNRNEKPSKDIQSEAVIACSFQLAKTREKKKRKRGKAAKGASLYMLGVGLCEETRD